ncbi:hypothetical protein CC1G_06746 [Coprinopsis cinerea okayama7|uniref:Elongator complex protein 5 n=1 Tax=Coprinopsis cinerea (strain Okayama-7 / 130 / ATCC MYA-4618 / FGSC 9003) TaxID=240176 RepID=A8N1I0_COPC7|nr:hypothetical protein CC1G_06746 [Coprinopsis cinerea okayama7\|eukprot:XP_001828760.2 hypothetical protein CC1G_06746 [Coprinopsis cinerea okayama7\
MTLLQSFISESRNKPSTVIFQSSPAQTTLPVLRQLLTSEILKDEAQTKQFLLFSLLYSPHASLSPDHPVQVYDWLENVPGYGTSSGPCPGEAMYTVVKQALSKSTGPVYVTIDSLDTLASDIGSTSEAYKALRELHSLLSSRAGSLLILHGLEPKLISLLIQPSFTPSLMYLKGHPPGIVAHIATEYLTPPPPYSTIPKFWSIFTPLSERRYTVNELVFGTKSEIHKEVEEILLEVLVRRPGGQGSKKRSIERELEAWSANVGPCEWTQLDTLRSVWSKSAISEPTTAVDPTENLSFNLSMTTAQQEARAQVPLPYVHEGDQTPKAAPSANQGVILYDPDSADDIDDDDPDEDLDI